MIFIVHFYLSYVQFIFYYQAIIILTFLVADSDKT